MTMALRRGKAAVLVGEWTYGAHGGCKRGEGASCYFEDFASCSARAFENTTVMVLKEADRGVSTEGVAWGEYLPHEFAARGVLWLRAQLLSFVLRPNTRFASLIRKARNVVGLQQPCVAVHIRHGDACFHGHTSAFRPPCRATREYVAAAEELAAAYGISHAYVATDHSRIAKEGGVVSETLRISRLEFDRSMFDSNWFIEYRMAIGAVDKRAVAETALLDLFLMASCDAFVGGFVGHYSRLAFELMVASKGFVPPYVSLDLPYGIYAENLPEWLLEVPMQF
jgi:hypothetical protein